ncbi:GMC oxidoreductase [Scytonema sp. NUACC21]
MLYKVHSRRRFLQNTALFSTSTLITLLSHTHHSRTSAQSVKDEPIDALIIGSGFGGAVAALRLGQVGMKTLVIERGRRWSITPEQNTFATLRKPDGRAAWLSSKTFDGNSIDVYTGVLELKQGNRISVLSGTGVGGGSLVYNAILFQPSREFFYRSFPRTLDIYDELDKTYYPLVNSIMKPTPIPEDILNTDYYLSTRVFMNQAKQAGFKHRLLDLSIDWNVVREEIKGTKVPSIINGEHWFGCNSGAKNSLDRNYLAQAEKTGSVEILPLHMVTEIAEIPGESRYRVFCNQIDESGQVVEIKSFTCRFLFLAAGSLGTSELLVKAKAKGTLPKLNEYIGQFWGTNGDTLGILSNLSQTNPTQGGSAGAAILNWDNKTPITLINFPNVTASEKTIQCLGLAISPAEGNFTYNMATDSVNLNWPADSKRNKELEKATAQTYKNLEPKNPVSMPNNKPASEFSIGTTAHPLGGAVLGKACDEYGRVRGYQGLYVVDGALIPGSTGCVNPALTIAALAERCMDKIVREI